MDGSDAILPDAGLPSWMQLAIYGAIGLGLIGAVLIGYLRGGGRLPAPTEKDPIAFVAGGSLADRESMMQLVAAGDRLIAALKEAAGILAAAAAARDDDDLARVEADVENLQRDLAAHQVATTERLADVVVRTEERLRVDISRLSERVDGLYARPRRST